MNQNSDKAVPVGQSEEEVAQWFLTHDISDDIEVSKIEMPNLHRAGSVRVSFPEVELSQINELAATSKKSVADAIVILALRGLKELRANPSLHL